MSCTEPKCFIKNQENKKTIGCDVHPKDIQIPKIILTLLLHCNPDMYTSFKTFLIVMFNSLIMGTISSYSIYQGKNCNIQPKIIYKCHPNILKLTTCD